MNANEREWVVEKVVGAAYEVPNVLGAGFLEKVYERTLIGEITLRGLRVRPQASFPITYKGLHIGNYLSDMPVEEQLIVELKRVESFGDEHLAQCINYPKASGIKIALLINFQKPKLEWKRVVLNL